METLAYPGNYLISNQKSSSSSRRRLRHHRQTVHSCEESTTIDAQPTISVPPRNDWVSVSFLNGLDLEFRSPPLHQPIDRKSFIHIQNVFQLI